MNATILRRVVFSALLSISVFICLPLGAADETTTLKGDAARPEMAHWIRTELYFATGLVGDPHQRTDEKAWLDFLDKEVTPRFPDGLTVFDAYGQWRRRGSDTPGRLVSKVLVILRPDDEASARAIDEIRLAWKKATGDQSVLLVNEKVDVSF